MYKIKKKIFCYDSQFHLTMNRSIHVVVSWQKQFETKYRFVSVACNVYSFTKKKKIAPNIKVE